MTDTTTALAHWRRWARRQPQIPHARAGSIESRYRSPQVWHAEQPREPLDMRLATLVENAWARQGQDARLALRWVEVWQMDERPLRRRVQRELGIAWSQWPQWYGLRRAAFIATVRDALDTDEQADTLRAI